MHRWTTFVRATIALLTLAAVLALDPGAARAATNTVAGFPHPANEVVYKEYWVPHSSFTGGCGADDKGPNARYIEPGDCTKTVSINIPDDVSGVAKVEVFLDLWRNRDDPAIRFSVNGNGTHTPDVGSDWSRTPWVGEIPVGELVQGNNSIAFSVQGGRRAHVKDVAFRVYHTPANPLVAGPGSDVTPPTGSLTQVDGGSTAGRTLDISDNQIVLRATASDNDAVERVEFFAKYPGYDEDNDGLTDDWHHHNRNNWNPGGVDFASFGAGNKATGGTTHNAGTDTTASGSTYQVNFDASLVPAPADAQFAARIVDASGNVRESAGGVSGIFDLTRSNGTSVEWYRINNFEDAGIYVGGDKGEFYNASITLPSLDGVTEAHILGNYWTNPFLSINGNTRFKVFQNGDPRGADTWLLSDRTVNVSQFRQGSNALQWTYNPDEIEFGHFVEKPGPAVVLIRTGGDPDPDPDPGQVPPPAAAPAPSAPATGLPWADETREHRVGVSFAAGPAARLDRVGSVTFDVDPIDPESIRVVEIDQSGTVVDDEVVHQVVGSQLLVHLEGATAANAVRRYHVYYNEPGAAAEAAAVPALVSVVDGTDAGRAAFVVSTPQGTVAFQKLGGAVSSFVDVNGNDWIGWNGTAGSRGEGEFRGTPNMPYPDALFHPSTTGSTNTTMTVNGPLRVVLRSTNGQWRVDTTIEPTRVVSDVVTTPNGANYWWLFEGPPGGTVDSNDRIHTAAGTANLSTGREGDVGGAPEWVGLQDNGVGRSVWLSHHVGDSLNDRVYAFEGDMAVVGFGRNGINQLLSGRHTFSYGFTGTGAAASEARALDSAVGISSSAGTTEDRPVTEPEGPTTFFRQGAQPTQQATAFSGTYGTAGESLLFCDWDGDGAEEPVTYDADTAIWSFHDYTGPGTSFRYGAPEVGDIPFCGDWTRDGVDTPGVFRVSTNVWYLRDSVSAGPASREFRYGRPGLGDVPLVGDWNGDGIDTPGIFRNATNEWHLIDRVGGGNANRVFRYGRPGEGDVPLVGDWNGDNVDTPGIYRTSDRFWYLRNTNNGGNANWTYAFGSPGDAPAVGDWNGDGVDEPVADRGR